MNAKSTPQTKEPINPPFCCDCAHFISGDNGANALNAEHRCKLFPMLDIVTGKKFNIVCNAVRSPDAPCGEAGSLFESIKPSDAPPMRGPHTVEPDKTT